MPRPFSCANISHNVYATHKNVFFGNVTIRIGEKRDSAKIQQLMYSLFRRSEHCDEVMLAIKTYRSAKEMDDPVRPIYPFLIFSECTLIGVIILE